jgi:hypothetical protein
MVMETYKIIRFFANGRPSRVIYTGLALEQAKSHCTSERTHKLDENGNIIWFDGFTKEEG